MPATTVNFAGLDFAKWGGGSPPDTVGDVGANHYIQAVNTSIAIWTKNGGTQLAAFTSPRCSTARERGRCATRATTATRR